MMIGQKRVHEERKPKSLKERTLQASPRHVNFISLLRNNFFLYQLASFLHFHHPKDSPRIPSYHHKSYYNIRN